MEEDGREEHRMREMFLIENQINIKCDDMFTFEKVHNKKNYKCQKLVWIHIAASLLAMTCYYIFFSRLP